MVHKLEQMLKMTIGNFVDVGQSSNVSDYKICCNLVVNLTRTGFYAIGQTLKGHWTIF